MRWFSKRLGVCVVMLAALVGCAAPGLDKAAGSVDVSKESIALLSVHFKNEFKPSYPLASVVTHMNALDEKKFVLGQGDFDAESGDLLLSVKLAPGRYQLSKVNGSTAFSLLRGVMDYSMTTTFVIGSNSVVYLGHLQLVNKEKKNKEDQASGGALPLIDQAVTGFGNGTLDVKLLDRYAKDSALFKSRYPALKNMDIVRAPLKQLALERAIGSGAAPIIVTLEQVQN